MTLRRAAAVLGGALLLAGCGGDDDKPSEAPPEAKESITLSSSAFRDGGTIPTRYTCSGAERSPPLSWSGVPDDAAELTLLVEDPDAGNFVHWKLLGLPPAATGVEEGPKSSPAKGSGGDWTGPCPPEGDDPHRYVFSIYATDELLKLDDDTSIDDVHSALEDHSIARGTLTGRYGR
ncbi:MAG TPA: YbhB/YbcL family Raf kinase inhibitor-like protein [Thermoleophilaceae bacterium]